MKKLIHHVRSQPHHVRGLVTLGCTVAVVAVIGVVWFNSFQNNMYALLNPEDQVGARDKLFTQESKSLFASMLQVVSDGRAQITNIFSSQNNQTDIVNTKSNSSVAPSDSIHPLPVSGNR